LNVTPGSQSPLNPIGGSATPQSTTSSNPQGAVPNQQPSDTKIQVQTNPGKQNGLLKSVDGLLKDPTN